MAHLLPKVRRSGQGRLGQLESPSASMVREVGMAMARVLMAGSHGRGLGWLGEAMANCALRGLD